MTRNPVRSPSVAAGVATEPAALVVNVLLVEDHPIVRFGVSTILRHARELDATIVAVPSIAEAARQVRSGRGFDLVILDLGLPDATGTVAIRSMRSHLPQTPILVLSASEDARTIREAIEEGASGFVLKSQGPEALMSGVLLALAGKRYLPQVSDPPLPTSAIAEAPLGGLTLRQREIHALLATGRSNKEIAAELGLAVGTVKNHVSHILRRLHRQRRGQVIADGH